MWEQTVIGLQEVYHFGIGLNPKNIQEEKVTVIYARGNKKESHRRHYYKDLLNTHPSFVS